MPETTPTSPAFPCDEMHGDGEMVTKRHLGINRRDYFAAHLGAGLLASRISDDLSFDDVSDRAVKQADSLLRRLAEDAP